MCSTAARASHASLLRNWQPIRRGSDDRFRCAAKRDRDRALPAERRSETRLRREGEPCHSTHSPELGAKRRSLPTRRSTGPKPLNDFTAVDVRRASAMRSRSMHTEVLENRQDRLASVKRTTGSAQRTIGLALQLHRHPPWAGCRRRRREGTWIVPQAHRRAATLRLLRAPGRAAHSQPPAAREQWPADPDAHRAAQSRPPTT
jgi:hypothetical protein